MAASDNAQGWWMYQGGPAHGGFVTDTPINSGNAAQLTTLHTLQVGGPVLSVPAVVDGYAYVGVANAVAAPGNNGGGLFKVNLQSGQTEASFVWPIDLSQRDTHGFTGMGCTPAVTGGFVYFSAFDGYVYCLNQADLSLAWKTNLRQQDTAQNQPCTNDFPPPSRKTGIDKDAPPADYPTYAPPAAGWSSPVVANGYVYVGMGEGENPQLFGFVYCMDAATGRVVWIFCTDQLAAGVDNQPNQIPAAVVAGGGDPLPGFTAVAETDGYAQPRGGSVWSGIAYDNGMLYVTTGNPVGPDPYASVDHGFPAPWSFPYTPPTCTGGEQLTGPNGVSPAYTYSVLILNAKSGDFVARYAPTQETSYRPSDGDIDFGGSAAVFTQNGRRVVAVANKNGTLFLLDALDLSVIKTRQLLPYDVNGNCIPTVDPHVPIVPNVPTNCQSDTTWNENYSGVFGAPAVDTANGLIFVGIGGPNYHSVSPGIDFNTTPFMRAVKWDTLEDAWPMQPYTFTPGNNLPPVTVMRYTNAAVPTSQNPDLAMYQNPGEASIGSPAIANDVVFVGTHNVALYAFRATDGTLLWSDPLGSPTNGLNGGYGYCMGPAIWQNFVVAGGLIQSPDGGVLKIYTLSGGGGSGDGNGGYGSGGGAA
ncbi:MAG TPA: PQQ-binding-like beta-propeller repeat protein [Longimicrobium sp.]